MAAELPAIFPHGGGIEAAMRDWSCSRAEVLDLSTGLHPDGPPDWLGDWMRANASLAGSYPDADGEPARTCLAAYFGVLPAQVLILAGAQAAIEVMAQAFGWQSLAIQTPCYHEPIRCAQRVGCQILPFAAGQNIPASESLWWTSPSNPDGQQYDYPVGRFGVWDESYMPFIQRRQLGLLPDVLRLGSLTKTFAIPGLRLGYVLAEERYIQTLRHWLPPWPAPTMALHILPQLLDLAEQRDANIVLARARMASLLHQYSWDTKPSAASFMLARPPAWRQKSWLADFAAARILVRAFPEWPQLAGWLRLGFPGSEQGWQRLEEVLCQVH